ncbi:hypothetical protein [Actinomadura rugatobispora]|uniref:FXSXX-COOH protein n=1 Tax=Actinomadura rugatobispora TaxID=1994 RepID=A0ABW1AJ53_9ACTN|nr:hypothetical protein GCM10010200_046960 [Actinomadura rugatobispora]
MTQASSDVHAGPQASLELIDTSGLSFSRLTTSPESPLMRALFETLDPAPGSGRPGRGFSNDLSG